MTIKEAFSKILSEWPTRREKQFKDNKLADFIRRDFNKLINSEIKKLGYSDLSVKASAGAGYWASVPWLSIIDTRVTNTTQDGVYPVFLFRSDGTGLYLSLNQGTTTPTKDYGKKKAKAYSSAIANKIHNKFPLQGWSTAALDLRSESLLGKSYEEPNIYSKFYEKANLPVEEDIVEDLSAILKVYKKISDDWGKIKESAEPSNDPPDEKEEKKDISMDLFIENVKESGLFFHKKIIYRFAASILTKQFILLTGLSGSGKTKMAEAFSQWICDSLKQVCFVSVGADWTNREPLLGFPNALQPGNYVRPDTGVMDLIIDAERYPCKPYFLILDEMNLSHVERYFADFLSNMESSVGYINLHPNTKEWEKSDIPYRIKLPKNLFIIGTVNVDETTYMFSPKVLDRAMVIEFRVSEKEMENFFDNSMEINLGNLLGAGSSMGTNFVERANVFEKDSGNIRGELMPFFKKLQEAGAEFGYRTASEISTFVKKCTDLVHGEMSRDEIIDASIMQKLLPRLHGSRNKIERILKDLGNLCLYNPQEATFPDSETEKIRYMISYEKLQRMHKRVISDGFTSYAEA